MSLQPDENHNINNNQDEIQNPNPTLDIQSSDLTVDSNDLLVPVRHFEEQNIRHNTEQDPQYLIQGSSTLSTTITTIPQPPIQSPTSRNYDPPPPHESDTYTSSSTSQQRSSPNNNIMVLITHAHDLHFNLLELLKVRLLQHIQIHKQKILLIQIYQPPSTLI